MLAEMLAQPFMQRALVAGVLLAALLASLGLFVMLRKMAFFGDGIAHSSLAGIALAVLLGWAPLPVAVAWAVAVALFIYWLERSTQLHSDTLIGIFFTASLAIGVILMSFTNGYQPELVSYLFGSILSVRANDLLVIALFSAAVAIWLAWSYRDLVYASFAPDSAEVSGVPVRAQTAALYVALAVATVLGVKILGLILIPALLVLPSAASLMVTTSLKGYFILSVVLAEVMILGGLTISYAYDLPSGATVILLGAALFFLAALSNRAAHE
ncbi:MAG: metal ABC transporter permease [Patescibacteria group bacterium]|nr:metal ABC transporter permease [Patescibacteria group bacterium]